MIYREQATRRCGSLLPLIPAIARTGPIHSAAAIGFRLFHIRRTGAPMTTLTLDTDKTELIAPGPGRAARRPRRRSASCSSGSSGT